MVPPPPAKSGDVGDALPRLLSEHLTQERHVPAVVGADRDAGGVLLGGGLGDLRSALVEADVDGLGALRAQDAGDGRRSDVVAVTDGSGYDESWWAAHEGKYSASGKAGVLASRPVARRM